MIVEYIRYTIPAEKRAAFESAYSQASASLDASPHCLSYELSRAVDEPEAYVLRIEWDSIEGHEQGFRTSAGFQTFFRLVAPYFDGIQEMRHYERTAVVS